MKNLRRTFTVLFAAAFSMQMLAQREDKLINQDWSFRFSHQVNANAARRVDLPHTWNAQDALGGKHDYKRGIGNYTKKIFIRPEWQSKRLFLRFEGANCVSNVFVNGKHIGEHRGGYGAFVFEITDKVEYGKENTLLVRVNNGEQLDVMPLVGDFNFYGGIYRDVHLLLTDNLCISPLDYASSGVYLIQQQITDKQAAICARINLSNGTGELRKAVLRLQVNDGKKTVYETEKEVSMIPHTDVQVENIEFILKNPRLWNGTQDPFMYQTVVTLIKDGKELDKVEQPLGVRYYITDPDKGFFLNGKHLPLHGVCRHQERAEVGNALYPVHHEEDTRIMLDMGVNAVRLAHYPQNEYTVRLAERMGFLLWEEIPIWQGIDFKNTATREKAGRMIKEMVMRDKNRCSVAFWGIANETATSAPRNEFLKHMKQCCLDIDSTRLITAAFDLVRFNRESRNFEMNDSIINILDMVAINKYMGWYHDWPLAPDQAVWNVAPGKPLFISEFGGEALYGKHGDAEVKSSWSEDYQAQLYKDNLEMFKHIPNLRGTSPWILFDFRSPFRFHPHQGGEWNRKGLVSDQGQRKKAWYIMRDYYNQKKTEQ